MVWRGRLLFVKLSDDEGCDGGGAAGKVSLETPAQLAHAPIARHDQLLRERHVIRGQDVVDDPSHNLHVVSWHVHVCVIIHVLFYLEDYHNLVSWHVHVCVIIHVLFYLED